MTQSTNPDPGKLRDAELKIEPRTSLKPHRLPKGWRWLKLGEWTQPGDFVCDPRIQPVEILPWGWLMAENCHPVRRKITKLSYKELESEVERLRGENEHMTNALKDIEYFGFKNPSELGEHK